MTKIKKIVLQLLLSFLLIFLIFVIHLVFSGALILPQTFSIGILTIHYYGIIMALAVASAFYLAIKRALQYGIDLKNAEDLLFWLIIGGFIGARLYHILSDIGYYYIHPADIIKVWNGGLSIYGALIGGLITLWVYKKFFILHSSFFIFLDWLTPSLILGQIIGRFGNLFNYEAFGYPTNLPWKMFVPEQFRPRLYQNFNFFHPFFLYEILGNLVILWALMIIMGSKNRSKPSNFEVLTSGGSLFFSYLLLYNSLRFCLEFLRIDSTFIHGFRLNAIASLLLVLLSIIGLYYVRHNVKTP